jgi:hypothetical protein
MELVSVGEGVGLAPALPPVLSPPVPSFPPPLPDVPLFPPENQLEPPEDPDELSSGGLMHPAKMVRNTRRSTQTISTRLAVITRGWCSSLFNYYVLFMLLPGDKSLYIRNGAKSDGKRSGRKRGVNR